MQFFGGFAAPGAALTWSQTSSCWKYQRELRFELNESVDKLLRVAMELHFMTGRVEVAVGLGEKPVPYFRPWITGQGMEQARVWPRGGGIQVPGDVLKASQLEMFTLVRL